jgi:hypothetical protein
MDTGKVVEKREKSVASRTFELWGLDPAAPAAVREHVEERILMLREDMRLYVLSASKRRRSV